jgi:hypothetical protein
MEGEACREGYRGLLEYADVIDPVRMILERVSESEYADIAQKEHQSRIGLQYLFNGLYELLSHGFI